MASPFPGMNPYIERTVVWHDFHERWIPLAADLIGAQVLPRYFVRIDEQMFIHELPAGEARLIGRGDLTVPALTPPAPGVSTATATLDAPAEVGLPTVDTESLSFLEIYDRERNELITVVELLSPSNKYAGPDREQYLAKARKIQRSSAHFVEIDLLRGGPRMPWIGMPTCDYCVVVSRAERRPRAGIWPLRLRDPLPVIPIPLRQGEADVRLDLQHMLQRIYDSAGYAYYIYSASPEPKLTAEESIWAAQFLPAAQPTSM